MGTWEKKKGSYFPRKLTLFPPYRHSQILLQRWHLTMENRICRTWDEINYLWRDGKARGKKSLPTDWSYSALFQETKNCFWCCSIQPERSQREQKGKGGRRREGRGEKIREGRGDEERGGESMYTLPVCLLSPNTAFGKEKNKASCNSSWVLFCNGSRW